MDEKSWIASIGEKLKQERESQGLSHQDVMQAIKIRPRIIQAIEQGDHNNLPDAIYLKGLIRSYIEFLGNEELLLFQDYPDTPMRSRKKIKIDFPEILPHNFRISPFALILSMALIVGLFIYDLIFYGRTDPLMTGF